MKNRTKLYLISFLIVLQASGCSVNRLSRETGDHELKVVCVYLKTLKPVKNQKILLYKNNRLFTKARTNNNGEWLVSDLPSGIYNLIVSRKGFVELEFEIDLLLDKSRHIDLKMITLDQSTIY